MTGSDWEPTFTWSLSLAAFDDKAELQCLKLGAKKRTLAIACRMRSRQAVVQQLHSIKHSG